MDSFFCVNPNIFPIFPFSPANSNLATLQKRVHGSVWKIDSGEKNYIIVDLKDFGFSGTIGSFPCIQAMAQVTSDAQNVNADVYITGYKVENTNQITFFLNRSFTGGLTIAASMNLQ